MEMSDSRGGSIKRHKHIVRWFGRALPPIWLRRLLHAAPGGEERARSRCGLRRLQVRTAFWFFREGEVGAVAMGAGDRNVSDQGE